MLQNWLMNDQSKDVSESYAKFVLFHFYLNKTIFKMFMEQFKLFCNYNGKRYICLGLHNNQYLILRDKYMNIMYVDYTECYNWGDHYYKIMDKVDIDIIDNSRFNKAEKIKKKLYLVELKKQLYENVALRWRYFLRKISREI